MELETARIKTRDYDDGLMKCEETLISEVRSPLPKLLYVGVGVGGGLVSGSFLLTRPRSWSYPTLQASKLSPDSCGASLESALGSRLPIGSSRRRKAWDYYPMTITTAWRDHHGEVLHPIAWRSNGNQVAHMSCPDICSRVEFRKRVLRRAPPQSLEGSDDCEFPSGVNKVRSTAIHQQSQA